MDIFQAIYDAISCVGEKLLCVARAIMQFLIDLVLWAPRYLYKEFADYIGAFVKSMHLDDNLTAIYSALQSFEPYWGYWWDLFDISTWLMWIIPAIGLRFVLRHLPVVGG